MYNRICLESQGDFTLILHFAISANQREYSFGNTRFRHVISFVQTILKKKFTLLGKKSPFWRESPVVIGRFKIRVLQKQQIALTLNPHFLTKSVKRKKRPSRRRFSLRLVLCRNFQMFCSRAVLDVNLVSAAGARCPVEDVFLLAGEQDFHDCGNHRSVKDRDDPRILLL